ncbi:MAG: serine/threonine protein kinase [Verrucomicrobia bacterium]|nr:serine/threonine protein kinase [Verrucomicrobiota bacterium]
MESVDAKCPQCGARFELGPQYWDRNVVCPECGGKFFVASPTVAGEVPSEPGGRRYASETEVPQVLQVGDVILNLYEVKQVHDSGGMGLVYRVHHRGWNTDLAVKSPRAEHFETEAQKEDFARECETWIDLGLHPHIVSCHYVRTLGGIPRVFAEYVEGGSLKDWIDKRRLYEGGRQAALQRILDIAIQMAWGLHYAHEREGGLIHQDVKPANVMMSPDGTAKLTDFGLARARVVTAEPAAAAAGRSLLVSAGGYTPAYCSPEQANRQPLSRKTDLWSWAVSVLEMFVGEVCWQSGVAAPEVLKQVAQLRIQGVALPEMPEALRVLLGECLTSDLEGRPSGAGEVSRRLLDLYHREVAEEHPRPEPAPAESRSDALNNRALSLLDLGRAEAALGVFDQGLSLEPGHVECQYNRGLWLWRTGKLTDEGLLAALRDATAGSRSGGRGRHLVGLVHLERGDGEAAVRELELACREEPVPPEASAALDQARELARRSDPLHIYEGEEKSVALAALSADGRRVVFAGGNDRLLRLWDVDRRPTLGCDLGYFSGHTDQVRCLALSADGEWALSGSADNTLRLWEVASGRCVRVVVGEVPRSLALSNDGAWAVSSDFHDTVRQVEMGSGVCLQTFKTRGLNALSADGRWVLSTLGTGNDRSLRLWEVARGRCVRTMKAQTPGMLVALSADGGWALFGGCASAHADKILRLCALPIGPKCPWALVQPTAHTGQAEQLARYRASLELGTKCLVRGEWQRAQRAARDALEGKGYGQSKEALDVLSRANLHGRRRELRRGFCRAVLVLDGDKASASSVAVSADGECALSGSYDRILRLWDLIDCRSMRNFEGHTDRVSAVAISSDGRLGLSGAHDKTLRLWEMATGRCLQTLRGHGEVVNSVALSADGRWALSGSKDMTLRLWELATGRCPRILKGHSSDVISVAFSPDERWVFSGAAGYEKPSCLRRWELGDTESTRPFEESSGPVTSAVLSADGHWALSSGRDMTLRLWNVATGRCVRTFGRHAMEVDSVAISRDGRFALSGSRDWMVRLWDVTRGDCVRVFEGHTQRVTSLAFSADGRWALSGSWDQTIRLWELEWECEFPEPADWDEGARPILDAFRALQRPRRRSLLMPHCPTGQEEPIRDGKPEWGETDLQRLLSELQYRGYGWLRPEGVRRELERMTAQWQGPPPLPWERGVKV